MAKRLGKKRKPLHVQIDGFVYTDLKLVGADLGIVGVAPTGPQHTSVTILDTASWDEVRAAFDSSGV